MGKIKTLEIDGMRVKLQLWDTAGQERFRTITNAYYRGAHGVLLVYDVTDEHTFMNIRTWMQNINQYANDQISKVIIGNKCDMVNDREVTLERAKNLASEYDVPFFECSAKNSINVNQAFMRIARDIIKKKESDPNETGKNEKNNDNIKLHKRKKGKQNGQNCACQL